MAKYKATNNFKLTKFGFYERLKYKTQAFRDTEHTNVQDFSLAEMVNYGRFDEQYYPVVLNQEYLKHFSNGKSAINFVTEGFNEVVDRFQIALGFEKISEKEKYLSFVECKRGFENPYTLYDEHVNDLMTTYINSFLNPKKIYDLQHFINYLITYMHKMDFEFPLTFSSWIKNKKCPPFISGLWIDVANMPFGDDPKKEEGILNSNNLDYFINTCKAFGFFVTKENPSVIIADVTSDATAWWMQRNNVFGTKMLFKKYYTRAHKLDLQLLADIIIKYYDIFLEKYKFINNINVSRNNITYNNIFIRDINYNKNIDFNNLITLYTIVKNIEENSVFGESDINRYISNAKKINKRVDREAATDYINLQFHETTISKPGSMIYYDRLFKEKQKQDKEG